MSTVKVLVVDEIDRMLEKGHFQELQHIVLRIHAELVFVVERFFLILC